MMYASPHRVGPGQQFRPTFAFRPRSGLVYYRSDALVWEEDLCGPSAAAEYPAEAVLWGNEAMTAESSDPVPAITEAKAEGRTAAIFADIRETLSVEVVNLVWRYLATMPGALEWAWGELKPLYHGAAVAPAAGIRGSLALPNVTAFSIDTLAAAGVDQNARGNIRDILDSYYHTNALALIALSSLLARHDGSPAHTETAARAPEHLTGSQAVRAKLPRLTPLSELDPSVARLIVELNSFGEDKDPALVASMYRHLSHWPAYLALVRTMLAPLQSSGQLQSLVDAARRTGQVQGMALAPLLAGSKPPAAAAADALAAVRRFVEHPIARMTGICALMRQATPR